MDNALWDTQVILNLTYTEASVLFAEVQALISLYEFEEAKAQPDSYDEMLYRHKKRTLIDIGEKIIASVSQ